MTSEWPRFGRTAALVALAGGVVAGSAILWIGLPLLVLRVAGELTSTPEEFLLVVLLGIPLSMVAFGWLLYRLNAVYERLRPQADAPIARSAWLVSYSDERRGLRRARARRSLLDLAMTASAWAALVLMAIWFFFLADSPLAPLP
jgi:hypothetical protein